MQEIDLEPSDPKHNLNFKDHFRYVPCKYETLVKKQLWTIQGMFIQNMQTISL
jgi:hypothetical protein